MIFPAELDFDRLVTEAVERARKDRLAMVDSAVLARLALLPEWTGGLAELLSLDAGGTLNIEALAEAGLIDTRTTVEAGGRRGRSFWLRTSERAEVGLYLRTVRRTDLRGDLDDLARAVQRLDEETIDAYRLRPWLTVVEDFLGDRTGLRLIRTVDELVDGQRLPEAVTLVAAVSVLGDILGVPLADVAKRVQWRIDRAHRSERDALYMQHYMNRREAEAAVQHLLSFDGRHWALHLRGAAGVGKTMLVRYLTSRRFLEESGGTRPVARVDFDHLPPRYPKDRPADLLLALAFDLLGHRETRAASQAHFQLVTAADALHEELHRTELLEHNVVEFERQVIDRFVDFLRELPAPPLLVLDTCEELAKLYTAGASAPAIDRTFELLEQIHDRFQGVRVLLLGRRLLVPSADPLRRAAEPRLRERPYVRVLTMHGFDATEARSYVQGRLAGTPQERHAEAVLETVARRGGDNDYNPFDLHGYCEWVRDDADLDVGALAGVPGDPLIELRILGRLGESPARRALPVAAAFGRFDVALVAPSLDRLGIDVSEAFRDLAAQEWVSTIAVGPTGMPDLIEIDPNWCGRLRVVLAAREPVDRDALGRDAAAVVRRGDLGHIPAETVEAALHLLPVAEVGAFWTDLEERVVAQREWAWAGQVSARAAGVEAQLRPDGPSILAAILATQAASRLHAGLTTDTSPIWADVASHAERHPDPAHRARLAARAALGRVGEVGVPLPSADALAAAPIAAVVAAIERLIDRGADAGPLLWHVALQERIDPVAAVALGLCRAVLSLQRDQLAGAEACEAAAAAERLRPSDRVPYADWVVPEHLLDRCRLAVLLASIAEPSVRPARAGLDRWWAEAATRPHAVDAERLMSALCALDADAEPDEKLTQAATFGYVLGRRPRHWLHQQVPPLVVAVADRLGTPAGVTLLEQHLSAVAVAGDDPDHVEQCQLALLRRCRTDRTIAHLPNIEDLARFGTPHVRAEAWLTLALIQDLVPPSVEAAGSFYGWWRTCTKDRAARSEMRDEDELFAGSAAATVADYELIRPGLSGSPPRRSAVAAALLLPHALEEYERYHIARRMATSQAPPGLPRRLVDPALVGAGEVLAIRAPKLASEVLVDAAAQMCDRSPEQAWKAAVLARLAAGRSVAALVGAARPRVRATRLARQLETRLGITPVAMGEGWRSRRRAMPGWLPRPVATNRLEVTGGRRSALALLNVILVPATAVFALRFPAVSLAGTAVLLALALLLLLARRALPVNSIGLHVSVSGRRLSTTCTTSVRRRSIVPRRSRLRPWLRHRVNPVTLDMEPPFPSLDRAFRRARRRPIRMSLSIDRTTDRWTERWEQAMGQRAESAALANVLWHRIVPIAMAAPRDCKGIAYLGPLYLAPPGTGVPPLSPLVRHMVGAPLKTWIELLFVVHDETPAEAELWRSALRLDRIASRGQVLVLHAPPIDGPARCFGADGADYLTLARAAVEAGASAVFLVPPLPDEAAARAVRLVEAAAARWDDGFRRDELLELLRDLKATVAEFEPERTPWGERPVVDVQLVMRR
ncbi:hypothetical protein [Dactylosporangium salmoneum]|uniref:Orc1-like AAA ATPase domain-containing protein n=1 Tax=Dactylosporangium salmoneum TaxID=53361 RepID=A0ABN3FMN9_9ACTN